MIATLSMMSALQIVGSLTTIRVVVQDEIPRVPMMFQREKRFASISIWRDLNFLLDNFLLFLTPFYSIGRRCLESISQPSLEGILFLHTSSFKTAAAAISSAIGILSIPPEQYYYLPPSIGIAPPYRFSSSHALKARILFIFFLTGRYNIVPVSQCKCVRCFYVFIDIQNIDIAKFLPVSLPNSQQNGPLRIRISLKSSPDEKIDGISSKRRKTNNGSNIVSSASSYSLTSSSLSEGDVEFPCGEERFIQPFSPHRSMSNADLSLEESWVDTESNARLGRLRRKFSDAEHEDLFLCALFFFHNSDAL
mmetsp:Transcript_27394/g.54937  ORF Transcript_27394/g.54937 Transcript_27394/m.54937 type:complete len:307 (-) Transcript_27394:63-983(-)